MIDGEIDILIGSDFYWSLVTEDVVRLTENLVLVRSKLGYMLSGPINDVVEKNVNSHAVNCVHTMKVSTALDSEFEIENVHANKQLEEQVEKFWNLDSMGIVENERSVFDENLQKIEIVDGRYRVELPFKEGHPLLEDNFSQCSKRLQILKGKLTDNLLETYDDIISKQIKEGIVEIVDDTNDAPDIGDVTYLPHRPVIKNDKSTTKVRIVYDASARAGECSLNECLYKGSSLTPLIFDCWLRFRLHDVAFVADIESAYLQISVDPKQRDFLRFLWYKNVREDDFTIRKLRFTRVLFGAAPSQYLLNAVVRKHAEKYNEVDPNFVKMVKLGFYVDDLNSGVDPVDQAINFYEKCKIRFTDAGFNVRKWRSNSPELRSIFAKNEPYFENLENGKVLGIQWSEMDDHLVIRPRDFLEQFDDGDTITKRQILKILAGFFDPAGWIQPVVIKMKILFQLVCQSNINWDDKVPTDLASKWAKIIDEIKGLDEIRLPRCYCYNEITNPIIEIRMHGFSDASLSAYGACVYLKFIKKNGDVKMSLVASKSRVAPSKTPQTIPRLELMGAVVLSRLVGSVMNGFQKEINIDQMYCHTDSKIVLSWIMAVSKEFNTFVQNRVNEIRRLVDPNNWFYCRTHLNPSDLLTRIENEGTNDSKWWNGPEILKGADICENQPILPGGDDCLEFRKELKPEKVANMLVTVEEEKSVDNLIDCEKFSDLLHLYRVTAYVLRFIGNCRKKSERNLSKYPTSIEMKKAQTVWIKANQIRLIRENEYSEIRAQLNCHVSENGILRTHARMKNAKIPGYSRNPILLDRKHRLSTLIVLYCHLKCLHRGVKQTLTELRSRYWVTRGRSFVKKIVSPCVVCKKINGRPYVYPGHSNLPEARFDDRYPFASTGIDYLGPLLVLPVYGTEKKLYKAHVVLYTCTATRAMILDVVSSASSKDFLHTLRRFISRRGCPWKIITDNGSNFIADETREFATNIAIDWKYNVPCAPWMGGIWERLVSCVKRCLKKAIGSRQITYTELQTFVYEIENVLNNRPICDDYDDDLEEVLTPNHLLFGRRLETSNIGKDADIDFDVEEPKSMTKRERHFRKRREHFWKIWREEYLLSLREGHKSRPSSHDSVVSVNDIVLIYDKAQPKHLWKIGRITELVRSKDDGAVRAAKVFVGSTGNVLCRPVNKLYPIETLKMKSCNTSTPSSEKSLNARARRNAAMVGEAKRRGIVTE